MSIVIFKTVLSVAKSMKPKLKNMLPSKLFQYGADNSASAGDGMRPLVRRPTMGMALKEEAPAYITVRRSNGEFIMLNNMLGSTNPAVDLDTSPSNLLNNGITGKEQHYTDFTLLQIQESHDEKFSPQETFGEDFAFFSGERPSFLSCAGVLVNTADFRWRSLWWSNYSNYLRGTRCVENRTRVYLSWNDVMVEGYIIRASSTDQAMEPNQIPFNFTIYVTNFFNIGDLNLAALAEKKWETANGARRAEILGSREADVKINSQFVEIGPGFFERQLEAIFGTQNPEEAVAIITRNPEMAAANMAGYAKTQMQGIMNGDLGREILANPGQIWGSIAPALNMMTGWNPGSGKVGAVSKWSLAGRSGLKNLFGDNYRSTHSLSLFTR